MIINSNDSSQRSILTNKCYYMTTAQIMHDFEQKGYANSADETAKVIAAYHDVAQKKSRKSYSKDYHEAFSKIDEAIKSMANKVFYTFDKKSFDFAYQSFKDFDYISAIIGRQRMKKNTKL